MSKITGVFNAAPIYRELDIFLEASCERNIVLRRACIVSLIDRECLVDFSQDVLEWYLPAKNILWQFDLSKARLMFYECFDYFLFTSICNGEVHLKFVGPNVFASSQPLSLGNLNRFF